MKQNTRNIRTVLYDDLLQTGEKCLGIDVEGKEYVVFEEDFVYGKIEEGVLIPSSAYQITNYDTLKKLATMKEVPNNQGLMKKIGKKFHLKDIETKIMEGLFD